ncbi:hypothetical protein FQZ97_1059350 [compost metagenome]
MKGGVEARHLRHAIESLHGRAHAREVVRLVQRRKRLERGQFGKHRIVDAHRRHEVRTAMHDAMADRCDAAAVALPGMPFEQRGQRALVRAAVAFQPRVVQRAALGVAHAQPRLQPRAQAIGLARPAGGRQRTAVARRLEQRHLDRRRPGVEGEQRIGQT